MFKTNIQTFIAQVNNRENVFPQFNILQTSRWMFQRRTTVCNIFSYLND